MDKNTDRKELELSFREIHNAVKALDGSACDHDQIDPDQWSPIPCGFGVTQSS